MARRTFAGYLRRCYFFISFTWHDRMAFEQSDPLALNPLDRQAYSHHPALLRLPRMAYPIEPSFLVEMNGLRVPRSIDCGNNGSDAFSFHWIIPSRWHACHIHAAHVESGLFVQIPELPLVDEEYDQWVAVFESVFRARDRFVMVELGSAWGVWGARAAALSKRLGAFPHSLVYFESDPLYCGWLRDVMSMNKIDYSLSCMPVVPHALLEHTRILEHIDVVHVDIQGAEKLLLSDLDVQKELSLKAHRLIIGTHGPLIHDELLRVFSNWILVEDDPPALNDGHYDCITKFLRDFPMPPHKYESAPVSGLHPDRARWDKLLQWGCYRNTSRGPIVSWDGSLVLDNPQFVHAS